MNVLLAITPLMMAMNALADKSSAKEQIRVMPVARTPESNTIVLKVAVPEKGTVLDGNPVWIQFRIDGYALGSDSQFDRADEIVGTDMGQTIHVVIDDFPYFPINEPAIDPFNEDGYFYDTSYKFEVPFSLKQGMHTIRIFPARSFGESLKGENTFHGTYFYLGSQKNNQNLDLSGPYLTYNEPSDELPLASDKPVLLDFYLTNCELSPDGYKVRLTVDDTINRILTSWQPYYIYGLKKGRHKVLLSLLDSRNLVVPGQFNQVQRTITIH
ncbi:MAG: hypothetical protein V4487_03830 [Chlamydiota bacterium]